MSRRRKTSCRDLTVDVLIGRVGHFDLCQLSGLLGVSQTLAAHLVEGFALFQGAVIEMAAATQHKEQGLLLRAGRVEAILKRFLDQHLDSLSVALAWQTTRAQTSSLLLDHRGAVARKKTSSIKAGEKVMALRGRMCPGEFPVEEIYHRTYVHANHGEAACIPSAQARGFTRPLIRCGLAADDWTFSHQQLALHLTFYPGARPRPAGCGPPEIPAMRRPQWRHATPCPPRQRPRRQQRSRPRR